MRNLAGNSEADILIRSEFERSRIPIIEVGKTNSEVPYTIEGKLGDFALKRAWYYYIAQGLMPIEVAEELYDDPVGKTDIRVAGHAGAPPPREWATWITPDRKEVAPADQEAEFRTIMERHGWEDDGKYVFSDDPESLGAKLYVESYHIDSEVGLRIFADTLHSELAHHTLPVSLMG